MEHVDYTGRVLRLESQTQTLPLGTVVYCFLDLGYEFRVTTRELYNGVHEFCFTSESKSKFKIIQ